MGFGFKLFRFAALITGFCALGLFLIGGSSKLYWITNRDGQLSQAKVDVNFSLPTTQSYVKPNLYTKLKRPFSKASAPTPLTRTKIPSLVSLQLALEERYTINGQYSLKSVASGVSQLFSVQFVQE